MGNTPSHTHEPLERGNFQRGKFGDIKNGKSASFRFSKKSPKKMDRLRRSFRDSFRRRKDRVPESSKPHQWQADEEAVRTATCSFPVKYLGCVEVFESRGMQVCEEALKVLRNSRRRAVRGLLHVSGDGLRVADDETKGLIVDQTIEKVSFCAPDRNHERGFSYICRDGTTRRWMCHGFLSVKDSGERLSHAVGCAFAVCLERKQRRDKECGVTMTFDTKNSTFTRTGSFRQQTLTDRLAKNERAIDTPSATVLPQPKPYNPFAIERPHATLTMLERQGSFRAFSTIGSQSPFKRQMSLRINDLPSNTERQKAFLTTATNKAIDLSLNSYSVSPIAEDATVKTNTDLDTGTIGAETLNQLCQELTQGLNLLSQSELTSPPTQQNGLDARIRLSGELIENIDSVKQLSSLSTAVVDITADYSPPIMTTPQYATTRLATISPSATSVITNQIHSSQIPLTERPLPKPEQWLGKIAQNTSPTIAKYPPQPSLSSVGRTQSLSSISSNPDPFDAEWVAGITKHLTSDLPATTTPIHSTNPFITTTTKPVAQVFQI